MEGGIDLIVMAGALAGALASGFAGFAFGVASLGIWAHALPPEIAAPMVVICSFTVQIFTLPRIWRSIDFRTAAPFVAGGLLGIPIGVAVLETLDPYWFRVGVGGLLVSYVAGMFVLGRLARLETYPRAAVILVGWGGGVMGGFAGLSGILPTLWCSLMKWPKDQQRSTFQVFNLSMHTVTLAAYAYTGILSRELVKPMLTAAPMLVIGGVIGFALYRRLSDHQFRVALWLLLAGSGLLMLIR